MRICRRLARDGDLEIFIAGCNRQRAQAAADSLKAANPGTSLSVAELNHQAAEFPERLAKLEPTVVVHTAGPFQTQGYGVATACVECDSHYIDLADGREFVTEFHALNASAAARGVSLITGASTLPGLSSAVVNYLLPRFQRLKAIETSIVPGNRSPRGLSTVDGVLSYCGRAFTQLHDGSWQTVHGWQDLHSRNYPSLGKRWLGACDVPDLALFPEYFAGVKTVSFHAGLELAWQQFGLWFLAALSRIGTVKSWSPYAPFFKQLGDRFHRWGTESGAMQIRLTGTASAGDPLALVWHLTAHRNHRPEIPCIPAIIVARKLATGVLTSPSARPCLGLISLEEFSQEVADLDISWELIEELL